MNSDDSKALPKDIANSEAEDGKREDSESQKPRLEEDEQAPFITHLPSLMTSGEYKVCKTIQ